MAIEIFHVIKCNVVIVHVIQERPLHNLYTPILYHSLCTKGVVEIIQFLRWRRSNLYETIQETFVDTN